VEVARDGAEYLGECFVMDGTPVCKPAVDKEWVTNSLAPSSGLRFTPLLVKSDNHIEMIIFDRRSKYQLAHILALTHQSAFTQYRAVARPGETLNDCVKC
jgi:hypothetical protein